MKKILGFIILFAMLGSLWFSTPTTGSAQVAVTETPAIAAPIDAAQLADFTSFSKLGFIDELLLGPFSDMNVRFGLPSSWVVQPGAKLVINLDVSSTSTTETGADSDFTGATFEVTFNDQLLGVILLREGTQTLEFELPASAFVPVRNDKRHELSLFLDAGIDCLFPHETSVLVKANSGFVLPHTVVSPSIDLTQLPRPIFQLDSIQPEPLMIVLPDQPTEEEVRAGMIVAASFGRFTAGLQTLSMVSSGTLTEEAQATSHLLFVGMPSSFSLLSLVNFPAPIVNNQVTLPEMQPTDGIIQMTISPWNPALTVSYVGGADGSAVVKAAQALSSGELRAGSRLDMAVIANVSDSVEIPVVDTDRTFAALGYPSQTISGVGFQSIEYNFYIPYGQVAGQDAYVEISYSHSALMDFTGSGVVVQVNDRPVGSIRLTEESSKGISTARITLPAYAITPGNNTLTIQAEFVPVDYCSEINREGLWMTVHEYSLLHIPLLPAPVNVTPQSRDLGQYPFLFNLTPTLDSLAFVVPASDPQAWGIGAKLASFLGSNATGVVITPDVVFADAVSEEIRQTKDLILVGRATQLPIIEELNDSLPSPFTPGSDLAIEKGLQVTYSLPEGTNIGYLQLLPAPWNTDLSILAVMGSTPIGLDWAGNALVTPDLIGELAGTFAVVTDTQVMTADTRLGLGVQNLSATAIPGEYPTTDVTPSTGEEPVAPAFRQDLILVAVVVVSILIAVMIYVALRISRKQNAKK